MAKLITMKQKENEQYVDMYPETDWSQVNGADAQIASVNNSVDVKVANLQGQINQKQDASTAITTSNIYNYYRLAIGTYTGTGATQTITVGFTPKMVYVVPVAGSPTLWIPEGSGNGTTYTYGGLAVTNQPGQTWRGGHNVVTIVTNGFQVVYNHYSNEFMYACANQEGSRYNYFALG